jgi:hypothetical protein
MLLINKGTGLTLPDLLSLVLKKRTHLDIFPLFRIGTGLTLSDLLYLVLANGLTLSDLLSMVLTTDSAMS